MWKDEDIATQDLIKEYLDDFRQGIENNTRYQLDQAERLKVQQSLTATEIFCAGLLEGRKSKLYMHDLILMAIGFYGGHLTAMDRIIS
ncbi:MAG: hypothetical protein JXA46_13100 [Dehalococcoidales bacterium]|nr:hypothetical protein [Dehalococcoidales bacterium]